MTNKKSKSNRRSFDSRFALAQDDKIVRRVD